MPPWKCEWCPEGLGVVVVVVGSAGGVGAATVAVVSSPGPGFSGDVVGVTSLTDTLIGPKSFLDDSLKKQLIIHQL